MEDYFPVSTKQNNNNNNNNHISTTHETNQSQLNSSNVQSQENNNNTKQKIKRLIQQRLLIDNNIANERWGSPIDYKPQHHSRIYFQNVNSLRYNKLGFNKWVDCCNYMKEINCNVVGMAESCVDWKSKNIDRKSVV